MALSAVEAFVSRGGRLTADAEGFVRYAQVVVSLENRRAIEVLRIGFFQHRARKNGTLKGSHFDEVLRTIPAAAFGGLHLSAEPSGVIMAEHRFEKRRLEYLSQWKPTEAELHQLAVLVNRRAGRELL